MKIKSLLILSLVIGGLETFDLLAKEPKSEYKSKNESANKSGYVSGHKSDDSQALAQTGWRWQLLEQDLYVLKLFSDKGDKATYDLSECLFCSGEEDNCDQNGVFPVKLPDNEPAVVVVCHKGAHSQKLQVLAPQRDKLKPVFEVTGDFWIKYEPQSQGLKVTYDRRQENGKVAIHSETWPRP